MKPQDVPAGPLLVDTDVVSYWVTGSPQGDPFRDLVVGHEQAISFATYGELLANGHAAHWGERRIQALQHQLRNFVVVPYSAAAVELWAKMHARLSGHLHKGGTNDLWTAACALAMTPRLPIATNNLGDFKQIAKAFPELLIIHPDR